IVRTRVEQRYKCIGLGIETRGVRAFRTVAMCAGQTSILHRVRAAMLPGSNVINSVRQDALIVWKLAIFAATLGSMPNLLASKLRHVLPGLSGFLQRQSGLGVEQVHELADAEELFQRNSFLGGNGPTIVLLQQLPDSLGRRFVESEFENSPSH